VSEEEETGLVPTAAAPTPPALAWEKEPRQLSHGGTTRHRGWLIPVIIAVIASAVVSVSAVLMIDAKQMSEHQPPTYENCQYYD
jgi:hypothetical protein